MLHLGINLFWFPVLIPTEKFINKTDPLNPYREGSVKSRSRLKAVLYNIHFLNLMAFVWRK